MQNNKTDLKPSFKIKLMSRKIVNLYLYVLLVSELSHYKDTKVSICWFQDNGEKRTNYERIQQKKKNRLNTISTVMFSWKIYSYTSIHKGTTFITRQQNTKLTVKSVVFFFFNETTISNVRAKHIPVNFGRSNNRWAHAATTRDNYQSNQITYRLNNTGIDNNRDTR